MNFYFYFPQKYTQDWIAELFGSSGFHFVKSPICSPSWLHQFTIPSTVSSIPFPYILDNIWFLQTFDNIYLNRCEIIAHCDFVYIWLVILSTFSHLYVFGKMFIDTLWPFLNWIICFLAFELYEFFMYFVYYQKHVLGIFSYRLPFQICWLFPWLCRSSNVCFGHTMWHCGILVPRLGDWTCVPSVVA